MRVGSRLRKSSGFAVHTLLGCIVHALERSMTEVLVADSESPLRFAVHALLGGIEIHDLQGNVDSRLRKSSGIRCPHIAGMHCPRIGKVHDALVADSESALAFAVHSSLGCIVHALERPMSCRGIRNVGNRPSNPTAVHCPDSESPRDSLSTHCPGMHCPRIGTTNDLRAKQGKK